MSALPGDSNPPEPYTLYRLYDAGGRLLYVGITDNTKRRWYQHSVSQTWWPDVARKTVETFPTRAAAAAAEREAIDGEDPRYNARKDPVTRQHRVPPRTFDVWAAERDVAQRLRSEIVEGVHEPGTCLNRAEIAERYGVPILVVGFALYELCQERILQQRAPNRYQVPTASSARRR